MNLKTQFLKASVAFALGLTLSFFSSSLKAQERSGLVGIASVDITPPLGVPLAGYGSPTRRHPGLYDWRGKSKYASYFAPSEGIIDPIRAKAMVIESNGERLLFMSLDIIGAPSNLVKTIASRIEHLGIKEKNMLVSATHTHAGPGAVTRRPLLALVAVDKFHQEVYDLILNGILASIEEAVKRMEPADLLTTTFEAEGLQKNRSGKPGHFDSETHLLLARSKATGDWLGGMANLAVHGTLFTDDILKFSADVPGAMERAFEDRLDEKNYVHLYRPTLLFMNGTEGDVAPALDDYADEETGIPALKEMGELFADQAESAMENLEDVSPEFQVKRRYFKIGDPKLVLKACVSQKFLQSLLSKKLAINLTKHMPSYTNVSTVKLGDLVMFTWPGEPTTSLGFYMKEVAKEFGYKKIWNLGLTNDHLMYFTNREEYEEGLYEACSSLYNFQGGSKIIYNHRRMLRSLQR